LRQRIKDEEKKIEEAKANSRYIRKLQTFTLTQENIDTAKADSEAEEKGQPKEE